MIDIRSSQNKMEFIVQKSISTNSTIDYTNTCFHNTLVIKHDTSTSSLSGMILYIYYILDLGAQMAEKLRKEFEETRLEKQNETMVQYSKAQGRGR